MRDKRGKMDVGPPMLPPRRRRARAISGAPVDELLAQAEELTKGWLLALLEETPLVQAPSILTVDVARDGPRVCEAVLRAIASDTDLRRLQPGGALEMLVAGTGRLAGAVGPEATSRAVDALGAVIWSALRESLRRPEPDEVAEMLERLGLVIELIRQAALRASAGEELAPGAGAHAEQEQEPAPQPETQREAARRGLTLAASDATGASPRAGTEPSTEPLWVGAVKDEIARAEQADAPLTLLLVELEDADRVLAVERDAAASGTFGRFAQAVRGVLRRHDILACESDMRAWIIAPDTGRLGAQALGARIVAAVRSAPPWRGAPLAVSVGLAVFKEDGRDHRSLIEAAEESRFAAEASGSGIEADRQSRGPTDPD
jgi:GGDEF domain-containing protein